MTGIEIIETYWNVNVLLSANEKNSFSEIIETYWNVNHVVNNCTRSISHEIIETYWNVNSFRIKTPFTVISGNNRNILETYWNVNGEIYVSDLAAIKPK